MFCCKDVLKDFAKLMEKHLRRSLFFNEVAGLRPATLLKKETLRATVFLLILRNFTKHHFCRIPPVATSFSLKSLGFINCFAFNCFGR